MGLTANQLHDALGQLFEQAMSDSRLATDAQQARRDYFGQEHLLAEQATETTGLEPKELRFREWLLLERESLALGEVPLMALPATPTRGHLEDSLAGVFTVQAKDGDRLTARDLQDADSDHLDLAVPDGTLLDGDLVVGRLYRDNLDCWVASPAVAVYRPGQQIAAAIEGDLRRLRLDRRLWQIELEQLLLRQQQRLEAQAGSATTRPAEHLEAELQQLFDEVNERYDVTEISQALLASERAGPVISAILDELAFETKVDLERGRRLLLELWNSQHQHDLELLDSANAEAAPNPVAESAGPAQPIEADPQLVQPEEPEDAGSAEALGQRLARTLNAGLEAHEDVEKLFEKLEAMAGIEPEDQDADDDAARAVVDAVMTSGPNPANEDGSATDTGDFEPLLQEYLWETTQQDRPAAQALALFLQLQRNFPVPRTDLELITAEDVHRFLLHVYLTAAPKHRADEVRQAQVHVTGFFGWAQETQEYELDKPLAESEGSLLDHLDRLHAASLALSTASSATNAGPPALWRIVDLAEQGFGLRGEDAHYWVSIPEVVASTVRDGDLVLGAVAPGDSTNATLSGLVVVLPGDAEALIS